MDAKMLGSSSSPLLRKPVYDRAELDPTTMTFVQFLTESFWTVTCDRLEFSADLKYPTPHPSCTQTQASQTS